MKDSYGRKCTEFARLSPQDTYWSKTSSGCSQLLIGWEDEEACSEEYLETWPRSGILSNGIAYRLPRLTRSTGETESGSWPTPNTMDHLKPRDEETIEEYNNSRDGRKNRKALSNLRQAVTSPHYSQMFPTPTSRDWKDTRGMSPDTDQQGLEGYSGDVADGDQSGRVIEGAFGPVTESRLRRFADREGSAQWGFEPDVGRVVDGVPARVDRLRSLGNGCVPQVVEFIGRSIMDREDARKARTSGRLPGVREVSNACGNDNR